MNRGSHDKQDIVKIFGERLEQLLSEPQWSTHTKLANACGLPVSTVSRWLHPHNPSPPNAHHLVTVAQKLNISLDWLLGLTDVRNSSSSLLEVHTNASIYNSMKAKLFGSLHDELWLIFRTGKLTHDEAEKLLLQIAIEEKRLNKVRLLICNPHVAATMDQLRARRHFEYGYPAVVVQAIYETLAGMLLRFETFGFIDFNQPETLEKFEVYYSRYVSPVVSHVADPLSGKGQMVVVEANYQEVFQAGLSFYLQHDQPSQAALFRFYLDDFKRMFDQKYMLPASDDAGTNINVPIVERIDLIKVRQHVEKRLRQ